MEQPNQNGRGDLTIDLSKYDISPETGFLSNPAPPPLEGEYFQEWERTLSSLSSLIKTKKLREEVDSLPVREFNETTLKTYAEWQRAYLLLSFLGQSYVWMDGQAGLVNKVPKILAVPWLAVSDYLGMKPVGTYAITVLYNYGLNNPAGPIEQDNLYSLNTFTGTRHESYFFMVHTCVEMAAIPGIKAIAKIYQHMADNDLEAVGACLQDIRKALLGMETASSKMYEGCDPVTFFVKIRPFLAGFKDLDVFPEGIIYEGVDPNPREYYGASAGQSSTVYMFDKFLGTNHKEKKQLEFMTALSDYMPRGHREFLDKVAAMPPVRAFCKASGNAKLITAYNQAVLGLVSFRNNHIILVTRYIVNQVEHSVNPTLDARGTGGTEFSFLKRVRDDTAALKIV